MSSNSNVIQITNMSSKRWRMLLANKLRWQNGLTQSEALAAAWQCRDMLDLLRMGVVKFAYIKENGEYRRARGTLKHGVSAEFDAWIDGKHTGKQRNQNTNGTYNYWDLDKNGFRSFHADKLVDLDIEL